MLVIASWFITENSLKNKLGAQCQAKRYNLGHIGIFPLGRQMSGQKKAESIYFEDWENHCLMQQTNNQCKSEVAQLCPTLCDPMDCSPPGFSVHGIFQARVLKWVTISFSKGSSQPRDWTWVSCIADRCFTVWATREAQPM